MTIISFMSYDSAGRWAVLVVSGLNRVSVLREKFSGDRTIQNGLIYKCGSSCGLYS